LFNWNYGSGHHNNVWDQQGMTYTKLKDGVRLALTQPEIDALSTAAQVAIELATQARDKRNTLLTASDWTQVADAPVDQTAWATYRQALRDITDQVGFPETITWPAEPEAT